MRPKERTEIMENVADRKIFIVEDDAVLLSRLKERFSPRNEVVAAGTFADAKRIIPYSDADIILLDILLPDGNGLDLLPLIKKNGGGVDNSARHYPFGFRRR